MKVPRASCSVGIALAVAALVIALVALAFLRDGGRETARRERGAIEAPRARPELQLRAAEALPAAEAEIPRDGARASGAAGARSAVRGGTARPVPPRAPVRGRLVVAETLDPIDGVFGLRVRTADLALGESLVTRADGSFATATPFPRAVVLALAEDAEGRELVDQEALFDPEAEGEWLVRVPQRTYPTLARATVVDGTGEPVEEARVQLVPLEAERPYAEDLADGRGRVELRGLRAGSYRLDVHGLWARMEPTEVVLRSGPNDLGLLMVDPAGAGDVRVRIRGEGGFPSAYLVLRGSRGAERIVSTGVGAPMEGGLCEVVVPRVPSGDYVLEVRSLDGREYRPERVELSPPAVVELEAGPPGAPLRLMAHDAGTGERLRGFHVLFRAHGIWESRTLWQPSAHVRARTGETGERLELELPLATDRFVVTSEGHRPRAERHEPGRSETVDVALERGEGMVVWLQDVGGDLTGAPEMTLQRGGIEDVEVLAGEEVLGISDGDGLVLLERGAAFEALSFRKPGYRVLEARHQGVWLVGLAQSP